MECFDRKIRATYKDLKKIQFISFLTVVSRSLLNLYLIYQIQIIIDALVNQDKDKLFGNLKLALFFLIIYVAITFLSQYFLRLLFQMENFSLIKFLYTSILHKEKIYFDSIQNGDISSRIMNDSSKISEWNGQGIVLFLVQLSTFTCTFIMMIHYSLSIALVILFLSLFCFYIVNKMGKKMTQYSVEDQEITGQLNQDILESLQGINDIKQLKKENFFSNKISKRIDNEKIPVNKKISFYFAMYVGTSIIIAFILPIIAVIMASIYVANGTMTVGSIMAVYSLTGQLDTPIRVISDSINKRKTAIKMQNRVKEFYDYQEQNIDSTTAPDDFKQLKFSSDYFSFINDQPILKNINFTIKKGESILVKGKSGVGKSTLANLLMTDVDEKSFSGQIEWNDSSIFSFNKQNYYSKILKSQQDAFIFQGTIWENILLDDNFTENELKEIIKVCQLDELIEDKGEDFILSENGNNISGGQKQRIELARILIRKPQFIILDEPTSALNRELAQKFTYSLNIYLQKYHITSLIISHGNDFDEYISQKILL